jgi:hypothetical protein
MFALQFALQFALAFDLAGGAWRRVRGPGRGRTLPARD